MVKLNQISLNLSRLSYLQNLQAEGRRFEPVNSHRRFQEIETFFI